MRKRLRYGLSAFLLAVAGTFSFGVFSLSPAAAEEADVNFTVKNAAPTVLAEGPAQEEIIPEGSDLSSTKITYKNAKSITVTLKGPDGSVLGTVTREVDFSPDAKELNFNWQSGLLSAQGQYTIEVTATGPDGTTVSAETILFYYGKKTAGLPNTGKMSVMGVTVAKAPIAISAVAAFAIIGVGAVVLIAKKGATND